MIAVTERTCRACHVKGAPKAHCDSHTCDWWECGHCGAINSPTGWNPPTRIAYHHAACVAWARGCGIEADFVEVKR